MDRVEGSRRETGQPANGGSGHRMLLAAAAVSAASLWFEIAITRILSAAWGHQFAYLAVALALFGVGLGGAAAVVILRAGLTAGMRWLPVLAGLGAAVVPVCLCLTLRAVPDPVILIGSGRGFLRIPLACLLVLLPFFFGSAATAVIFRIMENRTSQVYSAAMLGGVGGLACALALMYFQSPVVVGWEAFVPALLGFAVLSWGVRHRAVSSVAVAALSLACLPGLQMPVSQFKALAVVQASGNYRVLSERFSPEGWVRVIESDLIRETPGQPGTGGLPEALPPQIGVFLDGDLAAVINRLQQPASASPEEDPLGWLDHLTGSLPYALRRPDTILLLGAGGGTELLRGLRHCPGRIEAVEHNVPVGRVVWRLDHLAGGIFSAPRVSFTLADLRGYVELSTQKYDLVEVTMHGVGHTGLAGLEAVDCDYLITVGGVRSLLRHLAPQGLLSLTCRLKRPPRDALRLLATLAEACEREGLSPAGNHIAAVRTWNAATLLAGRRPLTSRDCRRIRDFCRRESFDIWWLPDLTRGDVNRYNVLDRPYYYTFAAALLAGGGADGDIASAFDLSPPTDDRPYFGVTFRPSALPGLVRTMGWRWLPFSEWGYLLLLAAAFPCLLLAAIGVIVLFPLFPHRACNFPHRHQRLGALLYFFISGGGFVGLEVVVLQVVSRMWNRPIHAFALVVGVLMLAASAGSYLFGRSGIRGIRLAAISVAGGVLLLAAARLLPPAAWTGWTGMATRLLLLVPAGVALGIPFPNGLALLIRSRGGLAGAWAWAVSGMGALVSGPSALLLGIHFGHTATLAVLAAAYAVLPLLAQRLGPSGPDNGVLVRPPGDELCSDPADRK